MSGYYYKPLKKKFVDTIEFYFYEVEKNIIVGKKDLAKIFGVSATTIEKYEKRGLNRSSYSMPRVPMYDFIYAIDWYRTNIDTKHRESEPNIKDNKLAVEVDLWLEDMEKWERVPLKYLPKEEIERRIAVKDYTMKDVKTKLITEEVIESDKVDFAKAEAGISMISHLISLKKILPMRFKPLLKDDKISEVTPILDEEFKKLIDSLFAFVNIEIPEESKFKFWDVIEVVITLLKSGATPKELIKRLNV